MNTIEQILKDIVPDALRTILTENGIKMNGPSQSITHFDVVAVIGFSGEGFGGALGFAGKKSILKAVQDERINFIDGWIGEVTNRLLGRIKNNLLSYGVDFQISVPMALHGLEIQIGTQSDLIHRFEYYTDVGHACVWVDANWNPLQALKTVETNRHAKPEGALLMFDE
ncbi:MAG: hypothetical protein ACE5GK_11350 [Nitrospiria bacterium]